MAFKKKKNQVKSPSPESRVPETGSDPPIGSDRESGRDMMDMSLDNCIHCGFHVLFSNMLHDCVLCVV